MSSFVDKSENHSWKVKFMNLTPQAQSPFTDERIGKYLEHYKYGVIEPSTIYSEQKDTIIIRDLTGDIFADFVQGLHNLGMELEITKLR